jgi:glycosyltransferase involved in cell wall biosynthesis
MMSSSSVAVLFDRFGPYHRARLEAAGRRLSVTAIELAGESSTYDWEKVEDGGNFRRVTLFRDVESASIPRRELCGAVADQLEEEDPDVVAIPGWSASGALAALRWCCRSSTPAVLMSETTAHDFSRSWWRELPKGRVVRLASAALVGGRAHQAYLERLGVPTDRIFQGYDVVKNNHFAEGARRVRQDPEAWRSRLNLPRSYFLDACRFVRKKNLSRLVEGFARYREAVSDPWDLVLLGDGPERDRVEEAIEAVGIEEAVHLPGFKQYDELPIYYGLAGAFVHASTTEQWGLVVNEAMAAGLPVLVSDRCGCAPDLVDEGRNGYTFDPNAADEIAEYMEAVARGRSHAERMGQASREIVDDWGPDRFGRGLQRAVERAREVGASASSFLDHWMLTGLMYR